jgi:cell division septum initiation protein DivIVA
VETMQGIDELAEVVAAAKPRALGAGAIIDREQAMRIIDDIRATLPTEIVNAQELLGSIEEIRSTARADADEMIARAKARTEELASEHAVTQEAEAQAQQIVAVAAAEAENKRAEIDAYVESKLAAFEGVLLKTMDAVSTGRKKLAGESGESRDAAETPA